MKKIMFLYHVKAREYGIIMMLKRQLEVLDSTVLVYVGEFYESINETIQFMPDIIVTIPPRDAYSSNYLTMLKIITGAVVISMNTEGYYLFTPEEKQGVTGFNEYAKELVDYYFMWGNRTKKELGEYLLKDEKITDIRRIKVIGYANYELDKVKEYNESNYICDELNKWIEKYDKCLLAITGFVMADISVKDYHDLGYFGNEKAFMDRTQEEKEEARKSIFAEVEFRRKYIERIIMLADNNLNMGIVVKLHPIEVANKILYYDCLKKYKNIYLIKEEIPVGILMPQIDGMIHYNSTCNLEAYIYGVPTIQMYDDTIKTSFDSIWKNISESTYIVHIDDSESFEKLIGQGLKYKRMPKLEKVLYEQFNWRKDREYKPIEKTAHYILQAKKKQRLKFSDIEVKKAIESEQGKRVIKSIQNIMIKKLSSNKNFVREIVQLVKIYMYRYLSKYLA